MSWNDCWAEDIGPDERRLLRAIAIAQIVVFGIYGSFRYPMYFPISESRFASVWWPSHAIFFVLIFSVSYYLNTKAKSKFKAPMWFMVGFGYAFTVGFVLSDPWPVVHGIKNLTPDLQSIARFRFWFKLGLSLLIVHAVFLLILILKLDKYVSKQQRG